VLFEQDLEDLDAIVLPGGESTTISKGLTRLGLFDPLRRRISEGLPVLGTCAGAILLAHESQNHPVPTLGAINTVAQRNAYGTQVDSFAALVDPDSLPALEGMRCLFIRAPQLTNLGSQVSVLARVQGKPVLVRQNKAMAATFHPELTRDVRVHGLLLDMTEP
jgi:5'-phosphate synthase pdxT subunit